MKILIAEDDLVSRKFLGKFLSQFGECDMVVNGLEAIDAFMIALRDKEPYDLVCLDIMLPKADGVKVLKCIRDIERLKENILEKKAKVIITTALSETDIVKSAFKYGCEAYVSKPIDTKRFTRILKDLALIP
jgi:two-component system chemotaxis response regulator CheY